MYVPYFSEEAKTMVTSATAVAAAAASTATAAASAAASAASTAADAIAEPTVAMKNVLSKITEKESLIPAVIPDGTKVISSLFGKLSKFAVTPPTLEDEVENEALTSEAEMSDQLLESPRKKEGRCCVSINVFYEDVFPHGGFRLGQLHSSFESYAASVYCYCL